VKLRTVAIYGAGYLGRQVLHHVQNYCDDVELVGFVDDTIQKGKLITQNFTNLGSLDGIRSNPSLSPGDLSLVFAIGYADMHARKNALQRATSAGYDLFTITHPKAIVEPGSAVGVGSILLGACVIDQGVSIGKACFVDIGVRLGAETRAGDNNYFSSGTCTGSRVEIGSNCFFGMNATLTTNVRIGDNLFINAQSLVAADLPDNTKFVEMRKSRNLPIS